MYIIIFTFLDSRRDENTKGPALNALLFIEFILHLPYYANMICLLYYEYLTYFPCHNILHYLAYLVRILKKHAQACRDGLASCLLADGRDGDGDAKLMRRAVQLCLYSEQALLSRIGQSAPGGLRYQGPPSKLSETTKNLSNVAVLFSIC
jgi:hypothetical protein